MHGKTTSDHYPSTRALLIYGLGKVKIRDTIPLHVHS